MRNQETENQSYVRLMKPMLTILAVFALGLLSPMTAKAQGSNSTTVTVQLAAFTTPACNGEPVVFTNGVTVTIYRLNEDSSGGTHKKNQFKMVGNGIGLVTGYKYKLFTRSETESQTTNPPGAQSDTETSSTNLTGPGPDNNLLIHFISKQTTNNLGVTTVDFIQAKFECPADGTLGSMSTTVDGPSIVP